MLTPAHGGEVWGLYLSETRILDRLRGTRNTVEEPTGPIQPDPSTRPADPPTNFGDPFPTERPSTPSASTPGSYGPESSVTAPTPAPATWQSPSVPDTTPESVGPYRIIAELGRGGMGSVLLGVRVDDPFNKRVAIKLIKRGMDSGEILRRFELERQVLSSLNHSNIARVLDAGMTEDGRSFFVMEFVAGLPIDRYCDNNSLSIPERLSLFCKVCSAVHYAHRNLIVHRDIKPGNIMVGDDGEPKLLDFGIAKILDPEVGRQFIMTAPEQRLMTPEYASPEQVTGDRVGTSSDVYSLGVLLYELLTGRRPYHFKTRLHAEIVRIISEVEPDRPSTAVSKAETVVRHDGTTEVISPEEMARTRSGATHRLSRRLSGDVDNIVLMAMRKDPLRRYQSAEQLAADIQRHLKDEPVIARPETLGYIAGKFLRRNAMGVGAVAAIIALLAGGVVATSVLYREADTQRGIADSARKEAQATSKQFQARSTAYRNGVLAHLTQARNQIRKQEGATAVRKLMIQTALNLASELEKDIKNDAQLNAGIAEHYQALAEVLGGRRSANENDRDEALQVQRKAVALLEPLVAQAPTDKFMQQRLADAHLRLADILYLRPDGDAEGQKAVAKAIDLATPLMKDEGMTFSSTRIALQALQVRGDLHVLAKRNDEALADYRRALEMVTTLIAGRDEEATPDPLLRDLSVSLGKIGDVLRRTGKLEEARTHLTRAVKLRERIRDEDEATARSRRDLAVMRERLAQLLADDKDPAAMDQLVAAKKGFRELVKGDPNDARVLTDLQRVTGRLMGMHRAAGSVADAYNDADELLNAAEEVLALNPTSMKARAVRGNALEALGEADRTRKDWAAAIKHYEPAVRDYQAVAVADASSTEGSLGLPRATLRLAFATHRNSSRQIAADGYIAAAELYEKLAAVKTLGTEDKVYHAFALTAGAIAAADVKNGPLAQKFAERAIAVAGERTAERLAALARGLELQGKTEEAMAMAKEAKIALSKIGEPDEDDRQLASEVDAILDRFAKSRPAPTLPVPGGL